MRSYITKTGLEIHFAVISGPEPQTHDNPGCEAGIEINDIIEGNRRVSDARLEDLMKDKDKFTSEIIEHLNTEKI